MKEWCYLTKRQKNEIREIKKILRRFAIEPLFIRKLGVFKSKITVIFMKTYENKKKFWFKSKYGSNYVKKIFSKSRGRC